MEKNVTDLKRIVREIENNEILLPDFQRDFEWKDEKLQKNIVCSILSKMPIGSILLLKSFSDEYICKKMGTKITVDNTSHEKTVKFLLDGQQRLTVLSNVFSNVIFDNITNDNVPKLSDLTSPALKRRFFLRIPKWESVFNCSEKDLFGLKNLTFPIENPDSDDPDFLTSDIKEFIEILQFKRDDKSVYNPCERLSTRLDDFCTTYQTGYLIPLYLLAPTVRPNKNVIETRYRNILYGISNKIANEIEQYFLSCSETKYRIELIDTLFYNCDEKSKKEILENENVFKNNLLEICETWKEKLKTYLETCVKEVILNEIIVSEKQRARAIDIYENLNRGGVVLGIFDLIIARAAAANQNGKRNLRSRLIENIQAQKIYTNGLVPDAIQGIVGHDIENQTYNASSKIGCYNDEKNEISKKYIDSFLNVLSLYTYNPEYCIDKLKIDLIKREKILDLTSKSIDENCDKVCIALDRAFFFLQTRCGIRTINEINYDLLITLIAYIFVRDDNFKSKHIHNVLEAYYWASLFSGRYDKDQTSVLIDDLKKLISSFETNQYDWITQKAIEKKENNEANLQGIFTNPSFSSENLILMERAADKNDGEEPKKILRNFICQFYLAKTYYDMFEDDKRVSVFSDEASELEMHHIIPLGSVKKYGETTSAARNNSSHICNTPVNFVFITKNANNAISQDPLPIYAKKITDSAKTSLHIVSEYGNPDFDFKNDSEIKKILKNRFKDIKGDVQNRVKELIGEKK